MRKMFPLPCRYGAQDGRPRGNCFYMAATAAEVRFLTLINEEVEGRFLKGQIR
jgi:hypothetical protein